MYPLLPVMQGASHELLVKAMDELAETYRNDEISLSRRFVWMELLLQRSDTVPVEEKREVQRRLSMFDQLWEDHPKIQQIRADSELRTLRRTLVSVVKARFPEIETFAQQRVMQIRNPDVIELMIQRVSTAPNADFVRWLLDEEHAS